MKYKLGFRNLLLLCLCILINLLVGNIGLFIISPDLHIIYRIIISIIISTIYVFSFYKLTRQNNKLKKWQYAITSIFLSLTAMLVACIFTSIGTRLAFDNVITAGLKGVIPLFIFAIFFASPFWIFLAIINFICTINLKKIT